MDKETLSNYGWIVICVLVLAVMIALAGPFGTFVAGAVKSTTAGLFGVNQNALGAAGIEIGDQVFENCEHLETEIRNATDAYTGDTCCKACGAVLSAGTTIAPKVPEGGLYTAADGTVYNPGDAMPENVTTGDKYTYMDYEYRYNQSSDGNLTWITNENLNGWGVDTIVNKQSNNPSYGAILETINGKPITCLNYTFASCYIKTAPDIPKTVTDMDHTYSGAWLTTAPQIPNGVKNMSFTFMNCTGMTNAPTIPESVTNMYGTFWMCRALTGEIIINTNHIFKNDFTNNDWEGSAYRCFNGADMTNITLTGSASKDVLNLIGATGSNWTPIE